MISHIKKLARPCELKPYAYIEICLDLFKVLLKVLLKVKV